MLAWTEMNSSMSTAGKTINFRKVKQVSKKMGDRKARDQMNIKSTGWKDLVNTMREYSNNSGIC